MPPSALDTLADSLTGTFPGCDDAPLALALLRELATGEAVAISRLPDGAEVALARWPNVNYDKAGRVVAFGGLSLTPTAHRFTVGAGSSTPGAPGTRCSCPRCSGGRPTWNPAARSPAATCDSLSPPTASAGSPFTTPLWAQAYWTFFAPPGAVIGTTSLSGSMLGRDGWDARIFTETALNLDFCPSSSCPTGGKSFAFTSSPLRSTQLVLRVICLATRCPNDKGLRGHLEARYIVVNVEDWSAPGVAMTGGDLLAGWRRGTGSVTLNAIDNVGIKLDRLLVDGTTREQRARACQWGARIPCTSGAAALSLDTTRLSDGPHTLGVQAVDAADNVGGDSRTILLDNTPPASAAWGAGRGRIRVACDEHVRARLAQPDPGLRADHHGSVRALPRR